MKNKNSGFTIVELIIVIAVIGVLAAILIPTFSSVIEKSNLKSALSDARNALQICIVEETGAENTLFGEGSVFKIKKAGKDWYFTYFDNCLHEGTGTDNSNPLRPITKPAGAVTTMAEDSVYTSEKDGDTVIMNELPKTVVIYNTMSSAPYTPPFIPTEATTDNDSTILITDATQLTTEFFSEYGYDKNYKVANDITLTGNRAPIAGVFTGQLDGNGKTVWGLNINMPNTDYVGLFAKFNGVMKDLTLNVGTIYGKSCVGGICGKSTGGSFTNVRVNISGVIKNYIDLYDDASERMDIGGLCGNIEANAVISRCGVTGNIKGDLYIGGIAGTVFDSSITESFFRGKIGVFEGTDGRAANVGGIAAAVGAGIIENCYSYITEMTIPLYDSGGIVSILGDNAIVRNCVSHCEAFVLSDAILFANNNYYVVSCGAIYSAHDLLNDYTIENCYYLATGNALSFVNDTYADHNSNDGTAVAAFTAANCPALSESVWSFAGAFPTLVNNHE